MLRNIDWLNIYKYQKPNQVARELDYYSVHLYCDNRFCTLVLYSIAAARFFQWKSYFLKNKDQFRCPTDRYILCMLAYRFNFYFHISGLWCESREYWPLIGGEWSHDLNTGLWLVELRARSQPHLSTCHQMHSSLLSQAGDQNISANLKLQNLITLKFCPYFVKKDFHVNLSKEYLMFVWSPFSENLLLADDKTGHTEGEKLGRLLWQGSHHHKELQGQGWKRRRYVHSWELMIIKCYIIPPTPSN